MKILTVDKLNYARFHNFCWNMPSDKFSTEINILFGWNGSGKTTFSKIMQFLETKVVDPNCGFKIGTDSMPLNEASDLSSVSKSVRVFNKDYVEEFLQKSPTIPYIFFAGKEAVDYSSKEQELNGKREELPKIILPTGHDDIAQNTAKLIREVAGINSYKKELVGAATYASYDKTDFEKRISDINERIKAGQIKSQNDLIRADINDLKTQLVNSEHANMINNEIVNAAQWIFNNINALNKILVSQPVQIKSLRIDKLNEGQITWIQTGVTLHFDPKKQLDECLFCGSTIENSEELLKHFSNEVVLAINNIDTYLNKIESYTTNFSKLDIISKSQKTKIDDLRSVFDKLTFALREKRNSVSSKKKAIVIDIKNIEGMTKLTSVNMNTTAYSIEIHYVSEQYASYLVSKEKYNEAIKYKQKLEREIKELDTEVRTLKQKIKNTYEPSKMLSRLFKTVFPYRKIEITDADNGTGYMLKRDDLSCAFSSLSEGEKNFIALAYFIYSINDVQNKLSDDGIVVIDDPVSSLDKQSIFQIFSIIVNEIKKHNARQYFILTHNLDFLGHLKGHFRKGINNKSVCLFSFGINTGGCIIENIHPLLRDHRSDYYYVFSVLNGLKDKCDIADSHLVVNLLRRWLETFLEFKFSTSGDFQSTLEAAYVEAHKITEKWTTPFDANYLEMYRFVNHGSHGYSDMESIDDSILNNAHLKIQEAFNLVKILDTLHYKKLITINSL